MDILYAPWRQDYVTKKPTSEKKRCVFCDQIAAHEDEKYLIVKRYTHCVIMFNLYPYNSGHLLVVPKEHQGDLGHYSSEVLTEMMSAANDAIAGLKKLQNPHGFNLGINMGEQGGGSIAEHIHLHIVPRWRTDTSFLEVIGKTAVLSVNIRELFDKLAAILT